MASIELFPFLSEAGLGRFYSVVLGKGVKSSRINF